MPFPPSAAGRSSHFASSKPSKSAIASDEKFIRLRTNSFVRYRPRQESQLEGLSLSQPSADSSLSAESVKGDLASAEARRWTEPVWQLSDRPRHPFGSLLTLLLGSNPTLAGRGGSVSRRDHNQATGNRAYSQAEPTQKKDSTRTPAALRERGSGERRFSQKKRPLPQNLPTVNLFEREREGGGFSLREAPSLANTPYFSLNPMTMLVPTPGWLWMSKVEALRFMLGSPMPAPKPRDRASSLAVE